MTEPQILAQTLTAYADHAGEVPNDLLGTVERGYRRRRRVRVGSITAALVVVAVVASLALNPFAGTHSTPAKPPGWTQEGPWRIPKSMAPLESPTALWPSAVVTVPATLDGLDVTVEGVIDATHVLVGIVSPGLVLDSYDVVHKIFARITTQPSLMTREQITRITMTPHWVVWSVVDDGAPNSDSVVYKASLTGGPPQYVGKMPLLSLDWYASDDGIYWGDTKPGVVRLPMSGGTAAPLPGFGDYWIIDENSPWAVELDRASADKIVAENRTDIDGASIASPFDTITTGLKNLATGEQVSIATKPSDQWLTCTPQRCFGQGEDSDYNGFTFIRSPDGSDQSEVLPQANLGNSIHGMSAGNDLLFTSPYGTDPQSRGGYLWDPFSGKFGGINGKPYVSEETQVVSGGVLWPKYTNGDKSGEYVLILSRIK